MDGNPYSQAGLSAGLSPDLAAYMPRFVQIESGGNPNEQTGSYSGLLQMGPDEAKQYGGNDLSAGAKMYADKAHWFQNQFGRPPSPTELYLTNQQGQGGIQNHLQNPDAPAWQNMYQTAEGQHKGPGWAKQAIWGNVPDDVKAQFPGGVDSLTSAQFMDLWHHKVERTPMAFGPSGSPMSQSPIQQALSKQMNGAPSMADNGDQGILSAVANYGPGALFGAGRSDYDPSMGLMGLGAGLTVAGGDAKGGSAMMNTAMMPMFKQNFSMTTDRLGNQILYNHRTGAMYNARGQLLNAGVGSGPTSGAPGAGGSVGGYSAPAAAGGAAGPMENAPGSNSPVATEERVKLDQKDSAEKFDALRDTAVKSTQMKQLAQEAKDIIAKNGGHISFGEGGQLINEIKSGLHTISGGLIAPNGVNDADRLSKIFGQLNGLYLQSQGGVTRVAGPEIKFGQMASPSFDKKAEANVNILNDYIRQADVNNGAFELAHKYRSAPGGVLGPNFAADLVKHYKTNSSYEYTPDDQAGVGKPSGATRPPLSSFSK